MKKVLKYKGIEFDDYVIDEYGMWSTICEICQGRYYNRILKDCKLQDEGIGYCGIKGCTNSSEAKVGIGVNYINFDINEVEITEADAK